MDKTIDAAVIASLSGYLAQIALILGIEAGLIAALLALKTYQGNVEFLKSNHSVETNIPLNNTNDYQYKNNYTAKEGDL